MNWLHFALGILVPALQMAVKNPASVQKEMAILAEVRDLLNQIVPAAPAASAVNK